MIISTFTTWFVKETVKETRDHSIAYTYLHVFFATSTSDGTPNRAIFRRYRICHPFCTNSLRCRGRRPPTSDGPANTL